MKKTGNTQSVFSSGETTIKKYNNQVVRCSMRKIQQKGRVCDWGNIFVRIGEVILRR